MVAVCTLLIGAASVPGRVDAADGPVVVVLGDSLTAGYGLAPEQAFPARLQARLAAEGLAVSIRNHGVSGDTSAGGLARLGWALGDKPEVVLLALGANDMLRGVDPAETEANLDAILTELKRRKIKVLLLGMLASRSLGEDYVNRFDRLYPALARKHEVAFYPFFLDGVAIDPKLNQPDGLHPNAAGVEVLAERIAPLLRRLLEGA